jgi:lipopolysaccharide biosynthesis protein
MFRASRATRPRVLDAVAGNVTFEHGSRDSVDGVDRVAVLVHWSPTATLTKSFIRLTEAFAKSGYLPVVVSACEVAEPLEWGGRRPDEAVVLRKPNLGYDFGSWSVALAELPAISAANRVILANDSMVGPFTSLDPILDTFEATAADVFGLTDTRQYFSHLQSYFLGFSGGILADEPLASFFADVRIEPTKWEVIRRYELGLSVRLRRECYVTTSAFRADEVVPYGENPVIKGWWKLLERGYPFVKREIVREPKLAPRGEWIAREVEAVFGEHIHEWI